MKTVGPNPQHLAYRAALEAAIAEHGATLDAGELLAITSNLVGQLIALQDQRKVTPAMALKLVAQNLEQGNRDAIERLLTETGGNA